MKKAVIIIFILLIYFCSDYCAHTNQTSSTSKTNSIVKLLHADRVGTLSQIAATNIAKRLVYKYKNYKDSSFIEKVFYDLNSIKCDDIFNKIAITVLRGIEKGIFNFHEKNEIIWSVNFKDTANGPNFFQLLSTESPKKDYIKSLLEISVSRIVYKLVNNIISFCDDFKEDTYSVKFQLNRLLRAYTKEIIKEASKVQDIKDLNNSLDNSILNELFCPLYNISLKKDEAKNLINVNISYYENQAKYVWQFLTLCHKFNRKDFIHDVQHTIIRGHFINSNKQNLDDLLYACLKYKNLDFFLEQLKQEIIYSNHLIDKLLNTLSNLIDNAEEDYAYKIISTIGDKVGWKVLKNKFGKEVSYQNDRFVKLNKSKTLLHTAVYNNCSKLVNLFIKKEFNLNKLNYKKKSPLDIACKYGYEDIVKLLLADSKVNVNRIKNSKLEYPIHNACKSDNFFILSELIQKKAKLEVKSYNGTTPLHIACKRGNFNVVKYLAAFNVSLNPLNMRMESPLILAIINGHSDIVKWYALKNPYFFYEELKHQLSALDYALWLNKTKIIKILLNNQILAIKAIEYSLPRANSKILNFYFDNSLHKNRSLCFKMLIRSFENCDTCLIEKLISFIKFSKFGNLKRSSEWISIFKDWIHILTEYHKKLCSLTLSMNKYYRPPLFVLDDISGSNYEIVADTLLYVINLVPKKAFRFLKDFYQKNGNKYNFVTSSYLKFLADLDDLDLHYSKFYDFIVKNKDKYWLILSAIKKRK